MNDFNKGIFVNTLVITLEAVYIFLPVGARRNFKSLFRFIYMQGRISSSWFYLCNIWIWPDNEFGPLLIGSLIIANWCILCRNFHHWCSDMILIFISEWQPTAFFDVYVYRHPKLSCHLVKHLKKYVWYQSICRNTEMQQTAAQVTSVLSWPWISTM